MVCDFSLIVALSLLLHFGGKCRKGNIRSNFLCWATPTDCCLSCRLGILSGRCLWSSGWGRAGRSEKRVDQLPTPWPLSEGANYLGIRPPLNRGSLLGPSHNMCCWAWDTQTVSGPGPQKRELGNLHKARMAPSGCFYIDVVLLSGERNQGNRTRPGEDRRKCKVLVLNAPTGFSKLKHGQ